MNEHKRFLVLIVISLMMLVGSSAGCAAIAPTGPAAKPTVNSFTVSPASISAGQKTTISWDVSGVPTVTIQPEIGTVGQAAHCSYRRLPPPLIP